MQVEAGLSPKSQNQLWMHLKGKILRRIMGPMKENNTWRTGYNNIT
jgi:hypothetical protein